MPPGGLNIRPGRHALEKEELLHRWKRPAALAFVLLGVAVAISAPAVAQGNFRLGANADIKEQLLPGQQIATLELSPASNARRKALRHTAKRCRWRRRACR